MRFLWDPAKERANKAKHGLDFSFAELVFSDPLRVVVFDRYDGEERWHCIGVVAGGLKTLVVVHAYPDDDDPELVRIIGLREATRHERRRYEDGE
ncbi:MAG: BrnT family toxin [Acetobacteraceae bacterium]